MLNFKFPHYVFLTDEDWKMSYLKKQKVTILSWKVYHDQRVLIISLFYSDSNERTDLLLYTGFHACKCTISTEMGF